MKKALPLIAVAMILGGCHEMKQQPVDVAQLSSQQFTLQSVDGTSVSNDRPGQASPTLAFSETLKVSGAMCNRFFGQGVLSESTLTVKPLAMTRMMCIDKQRNGWDQLIGNVLEQGAKITLDQDKLTLSGAGHTLTYQRLVK